MNGRTRVTILPVQGIVRKKFDLEEDFSRELNIYLRRLSFTPRLLDYNSRNELVLEYLPLPTLGTLHNADFGCVGRLLADLHGTGDRTICHRDNNPRNYLLAETYAYMIDFAEWEYGFPEEDLTHFLLFWAELCNREAFASLAGRLMEGYCSSGRVDVEAWEAACERMMERFDRRRRDFGKQESNPDGFREVNRKRLREWFITGAI
jgi:tRNA A-37 threonylcarbamoyl transferase component Bud32